MKLSKKEVEKVMSTSRAQSIVSSRQSSKMASRRDSMDMIEDSKQIDKEERLRTKGAKIINKLGPGESRDSTQMEQIPDPFGAEQTYLT